jgi:hypothetical protein
MNYLGETRFGINYRRILEPFDLEMYTSNIGLLLSNDEVPDELFLPAIEDFSQIDLLKIESHELKRFIQWRLGQSKFWRPEIVVIIVKDNGSFGMMRMFGMYAELSGFRSEENFYIATELADGVEWLLRKTGGPIESTETITQHFAGL